jgi:hypothetical protein
MNCTFIYQTVRGLLLILCCVFSVSCWPMRFVTSPGAKGVVVDSRSHRPIKNIEVFVSRAGFEPRRVKNPKTGRVEPVFADYDTFVPPSLNKAIEGMRSPKVVTATNGQFFIPPETVWGIYIVPMDLFPATGSLLLRRGGQAEISRQLISNSSVIDVGEVPWNEK